jgi:hypothetical protein
MEKHNAIKHKKCQLTENITYVASRVVQLAASKQNYHKVTLQDYRRISEENNVSFENKQEVI